MWVFESSTGKVYRNGKMEGRGYSGHGEGVNNPAMQFIRNRGPIPTGRWTIIGPPIFSERHGPYVLRLTANKDTKTCGRSGFLIHGDSIKSPGAGSLGCIVLPRNVRMLIWESGDRDLEVVATYTNGVA